MWVCTLPGIYLGTLHSLSVAVEADTLVMCSPRVQAWPSGPSKPPSRKCTSDGWQLVAHPAPRRCGVRVPAMYACASHARMCQPCGHPWAIGRRCASYVRMAVRWLGISSQLQHRPLTRAGDALVSMRVSPDSCRPGRPLHCTEAELLGQSWLHSRLTAVGWHNAASWTAAAQTEPRGPPETQQSDAVGARQVGGAVRVLQE